MTTALADRPSSATAALSRLLDDIDDAGAYAVVELNRAHRLLIKVESRDPEMVCGSPSSRWYRLYEQLAERAIYPDSSHSYPDSHMLTLSAALLLREADGLDRRAGLLPRHKSRTSVREQVAAAAASTREAAGGLLDQAIEALGGSPTRPHPPVLTGPAGRSWRTILAAQDEPPAPAQPYVVGSVVYTPDTPDTVNVEAPRDLGESLRVVRREVELDELAVAAAAGDKDALGRFLELVRTPVVRYCRARMGDGIGLLTAEDVAQDVLVAVCCGLSRFRPGETASMAFVYGVARNKVVDAFRAHGRDRSEPTEIVPDSVDDQRGPEASAVLGAEVAELRSLLEMLPPAHREVLILRVALGFSAEETAVAVGSTPGAVRVTQHRALTKLRALLPERIAPPYRPSPELRRRDTGPSGLRGGKFAEMIRVNRDHAGGRDGDHLGGGQLGEQHVGLGGIVRSMIVELGDGAVGLVAPVVAHQDRPETGRAG